MSHFSISQVSDKLSISKDTLRYYEKIGLIQPIRKANKYRCYSEQDILDLQYIEVMKYANFSLAEIQRILRNKKEGTNFNLNSTMEFLEEKKTELDQRIELYCSMKCLIAEAEIVLQEKKLPNESIKMNKLIKKIFKSLKGAMYEK